MNPFESQISQMMAELERAKAQFQDTQKKVKQASGKARSANRMVTVQVSAQGEVTDLRFHTTAYRTMPPGQLAQIVLDTLHRARADAMGQMKDVMGNVLPQGMKFDDLMNGTFDLDSFLPSDPLEPEAILQQFTERAAAKKSQLGSDALATGEAIGEATGTAGGGGAAAGTVEEKKPEAQAPPVEVAGGPEVAPEEEADDGWTGERKTAAQAPKAPKNVKPPIRPGGRHPRPKG